jgi:mRNA interferase RelE/StbE
MSYRVVFDPGALREFRKLPKMQQRRLAECLDALAEDPRPASAKKLTEVEAYRIRSGDYRLIYAVKDLLLIVLIVRVGNRRDIYKDLDQIRKRLPR